MNFKLLVFIPLLFTLKVLPQASKPVYDIEVTLLPKEKKIYCKGNLKLPVMRSDEKSITLILNQVMSNFKINDTDVSSYPLDTTNGSIRWRVESKNGFKAGTNPNLSFSCSGGDKSSFVFNISEGACFAGGNNTEWFPQVEKDGRGVGTIKFNVPPDYVVIAPGKQIANREQNRMGDYRFKIDHPSYFSFAAAKYSVYRNIHQKTGRVHTAYLLKKRNNIGVFLDSCVLVNRVLQKEFGLNPYGNDFTLVEIPTELANKTQFEGASGEGCIWVTSAFLDKPFNLAYYGHELSHHWWGNALGRNWWDSKNGRMMMDEALAQYGSHKVVETLEGKEQAKSYRLYGYPGYMDFHSASGYFMLNAGGFDQPLNSLASTEKGRILADSKGFIVYKMLSDHLGAKEFSRILQTIQRKDKFTSITWEDFLDAVKTTTKKDLTAFYQQWLFRTGAPYYSISWKQHVTRIEGEIQQDSSSFTVLLPLRGIASDGSIYNWNVQTNSSVTKFNFYAPKTIIKIIIDPDFKTLHWTREFMEMRNAFKAYITAFDLAQSGSFKDAEAILLETLKAEPSNESTGSRFLLNMALGQVNLFGGKPIEAKTYLQNAVSFETNARHLLPWAYYYLARASKETNDHSLMTHAVEKAIETEHAVGRYIGAARLAEALR